MQTHGRSNVTIFVEIAAVITAAIAVITYVSNRKHNQLQAEIDELDKQIKSIQLSKIKATT